MTQIQYPKKKKTTTEIGMFPLEYVEHLSCVMGVILKRAV
jgi:hypothetical protein